MAQLTPSPFILQKIHLQAILTQAEVHQPNETCGVILGNERGSTDIVPVKNIASTPATNFLMSPQELLAVFERVEREPVKILAFYHSHSRSQPIPSPTDLAQAYYPDIPMLIIGQINGEWTAKAYYLEKQGYSPISLHIQ